MALNEEERLLMIEHELNKADKFFAQAEKNAEFEMWDVVANRMYYSVFHAVSALLISKHLKVGTHQGAVIMFGQHFVKTGLIDSDYGRFYSQLQSLREKADYNCAWEVEENDVAHLIPKAKSLLCIIRSLIKI